MAWKTLDDMDLRGKVVLTRVDINVPVEDGKVTDATRIERIVPTIKDILAKGGKPVLLAHFDRPKGKVVPEMSLKVVAAGAGGGARRSRSPSPTTASGPIAAAAVAALPEGGVLLLENTRFHKGEEANDPGLRQGAGGARRRLLQRRLLGCAPGACLDRGDRPAAARLRRTADAGGTRGAARRRWATRSGRWWRWSAAPRSRPSSSSSATSSARVDTLVIGGGMANTFLAARGDRCRQVALRARPRRHRARDHGEGEGRGLHDPAAGRRCGRARVQGGRGERGGAGQRLPARTR